MAEFTGQDLSGAFDAGVIASNKDIKRKIEKELKTLKKNLKELKSWDGHLEMEASGPIDNTGAIVATKVMIKHLKKLKGKYDI